MTPGEKKRGRPKKGKQMVDTTMRVTKETSVRVKILADLMGVTMSEAIDRLIEENAPQVNEEIRRRAEQKKRFGKKSTDN